ncbi:beta-1,4-galactosyltransferase galt-1-like [Uloborus diversus]|uniref:beta-1,4-galactosyltransferase galt-1-like n=1 Tax=Uloborus diversus TaxID=327109 RepID=UPI002409D998|nr:beta-1,4-galactosyltransferase galt-1-like [Uloborus diversus]
MEDIYMYSAFWDNRSTNASFVRVIGAASDIERKVNILKCLLKFDKNERTYHEVPVSFDIIIEHHNKLFKVVYLKCIPELELAPRFVSIVPHAQNITTNGIKWIQVHAIKSEIKAKRIGLCVRPMFNYTDVFRITEFIAYYEALGVDHFAFYNYDSSTDIQKMINLAQKNNYSIDWLPWNLPIRHSKIWALGQLGSINDCFYRYMSVLSHIVVVDLDEFITPRKVNNIQELLASHDIPEKNTSSFVIRSTVFCSEYEKDTFEGYIPPFVTQTSTRREKYVYPFLVRTKYIAKPHRVVVAGVHQVWEFLPGYEERFVPVSHAMVHHYRADLCVGERQQFLDAGVIDVMSRKYLSNLLKSKVFGLWEKTFSSRKLCS